jgi:hypothetical protein
MPRHHKQLQQSSRIQFNLQKSVALDSPSLNQDPALCKGNHWSSKCPRHQMEGEVPPPMD